MNRYLLSFSIVLSLYLSIISGYIFYSKNIYKKNTIEKKQTRVKFKIITQTKVQHRTDIKKFKKKEKIQKKTLKKKKILKKRKIIKKKKNILKKTSIKKEKIQKRKHINKKVINNKENIKLKEIRKQKYFQLIRNMINQNKNYPRKARKRGIQGVVIVKFTVSKNGKLLTIDMIDGKKIFYKSVKDAIYNTFPISTPKDTFKDNFQLELKMVYRLKN